MVHESGPEQHTDTDNDNHDLKVESETSEESTSESTESQPHMTLTKQPDITSHAAPCANSEDILEVVERGRSRSHASHASHASANTQQTASDAESDHDHQVPVHRTRSKAADQSRSRAASSTRSTRRDAVKVPVSERRGLLARFSVIAEVTDPYAYSRKLKWAVTFIVAIAGAAAPMGSSLLLPSLTSIARAFHTSEDVVNLSVSFYMLSMSIFPLWWSFFSETLGRRTIYLTSFCFFLVFNTMSAVSVDIGMFIFSRCLAGGAAASVQAVGAGTIADIWEVKERGRAMGIFYLGPLCGPLLSPIIGGALTETLGWRSAQWFITIFGACVAILVLFFLPETLRRRQPVAAQAEQEAQQTTTPSQPPTDTTEKSTRPPLSRVATKQSVQIAATKTRKYWILFRRAFIDPLRIALYMQFPAVAITVMYSSITFGTLYVLNISIQSTFSKPPYSYGPLVVGSLYLPNSVGYFLASVFGGRWVDNIMHREARKAGRYDEKGRLVFRPEDRMKENAYIGAGLWPCALIAYGWCARYGVNVAAPLVANFLFGIGSMIIFGIVTTMLTEFMPRKASNGVALNNFVRNIATFIGTLVTQPLLTAIGNGWLFTGLGVIALVSGFATIWAMKRFGDHWRITMDQRMGKVMGD